MRVIHKTVADWQVTPNFTDYDETCARFDWADVLDPCAGMTAGGCNVAFAAVDRHVDSPAAARTALRFVSPGWVAALEIWVIPGVHDVLGVVAQCPELEHVIVVSADDVRVLGQLARAAGDPLHAETDFSVLAVPRPASRRAAPRQRADLTLVDPSGVFGLQTCAVSAR